MQNFCTIFFLSTALVTALTELQIQVGSHKNFTCVLIEKSISKDSNNTWDQSHVISCHLIISNINFHLSYIIVIVMNWIGAELCY